MQIRVFFIYVLEPSTVFDDHRCIFGSMQPIPTMLFVMVGQPKEREWLSAASSNTKSFISLFPSEKDSSKVAWMRGLRSRSFFIPVSDHFKQWCLRATQAQFFPRVSYLATDFQTKNSEQCGFLYHRPRAFRCTKPLACLKVRQPRVASAIQRLSPDDTCNGRLSVLKKLEMKNYKNWFFFPFVVIVAYWKIERVRSLCRWD